MDEFDHCVKQPSEMLTSRFTLGWGELRIARLASGLTIERAAEQLGVDPVTYSRWERGRQVPHPAHRQLLLQTFGPDIEPGRVVEQVNSWPILASTKLLELIRWPESSEIRGHAARNVDDQDDRREQGPWARGWRRKIRRRKIRRRINGAHDPARCCTHSKRG